VKSCSTVTLGFSGAEVRQDLVKPWMQCALEEKCISPPPVEVETTRENQNNNYTQDQAILSILVHRTERLFRCNQQPDNPYYTVHSEKRRLDLRDIFQVTVPATLSQIIETNRMTLTTNPPIWVTNDITPEHAPDRFGITEDMGKLVKLPIGNALNTPDIITYLVTKLLPQQEGISYLEVGPTLGVMAFQVLNLLKPTSVLMMISVDNINRGFERSLNHESKLRVNSWKVSSSLREPKKRGGKLEIYHPPGLPAVKYFNADPVSDEVWDFIKTETPKGFMSIVFHEGLDLEATKYIWDRVISHELVQIGNRGDWFVAWEIKKNDEKKVQLVNSLIIGCELMVSKKLDNPPKIYTIQLILKGFLGENSDDVLLVIVSNLNLEIILANHPLISHPKA